jgi:hypothetical protein
MKLPNELADTSRFVQGNDGFFFIHFLFVLTLSICSRIIFVVIDIENNFATV